MTLNSFVDMGLADLLIVKKKGRSAFQASCGLMANVLEKRDFVFQRNCGGRSSNVGGEDVKLLVVPSTNFSSKNRQRKLPSRALPSGKGYISKSINPNVRGSSKAKEG
mmetsp:Transcript_35440/g.140910  ORF Transcript_35440/g.140910 Transcript_35440/m.140910 type:complete len:108 (+) Transcript_35440:5104-5427(+)